MWHNIVNDHMDQYHLVIWLHLEHRFVLIRYVSLNFCAKCFTSLRKSIRSSAVKLKITFDLSNVYSQLTNRISSCCSLTKSLHNCNALWHLYHLIILFDILLCSNAYNFKGNVTSPSSTSLGGNFTLQFQCLV